MGCFLDCFGLKDDHNINNNNKRRFSGKKSPSQEQDHLSYVPLDSDVSINLDIKENTTSDSNQLKEKQKEAAHVQKIKKKVRFNLNVKAYEPIPQNYDEDEDDDDLGTYFSAGAKSEFYIETKSMASLHYEEENVIASSISTHRYQNCIQNYDEEDYELMMLHHNDLHFDEIEDDDDDDENDDDTSEEDFSWEFKSDCHDYNDDVTIFTSRNLETSVDRLLIGRKSSGRDRSKYVCSVLNPVENLSQWKAVKAKGVISAQYMCEKENF